MAEEGNGGASGIQGLPAPFVWVRMKRETRRSFPERLRGVGWPVGVAMASGGDGDSRSWGEAEERGGCVALRETSRGGGGSHAGRRWPGRVAARAGRVPVLLAGRKTTGEGGGGGLGLAGPVLLGHQVSAR